MTLSRTWLESLLPVPTRPENCEETAENSVWCRSAGHLIDLVCWGPVDLVPSYHYSQLLCMSVQSGERLWLLLLGYACFHVCAISSSMQGDCRACWCSPVQMLCSFNVVPGVSTPGGAQGLIPIPLLDLSRTVCSVCVCPLCAACLHVFCRSLQVSRCWPPSFQRFLSALFAARSVSSCLSVGRARARLSRLDAWGLVTDHHAVGVLCLPRSRGLCCRYGG